MASTSRSVISTDFIAGRLLKRDDVGRDFVIDLEVFVDLAGAVAVPEVGDVAVFLRLGDGVFVHACLAQDLGQRVAG